MPLLLVCQDTRISRFHVILQDNSPQDTFPLKKKKTMKRVFVPSSPCLKILHRFSQKNKWHVSFTVTEFNANLATDLSIPQSNILLDHTLSVSRSAGLSQCLRGVVECERTTVESLHPLERVLKVCVSVCSHHLQPQPFWGSTSWPVKLQSQPCLHSSL